MVLSEEERKERKREWQRKYRATKGKEKYETKYKEENKLRMREYNKKPEVIAKRKEYNKKPERKAKMKERYSTNPQVKEVQRKYRASAQGKAKMKEYYTSDKVKTKKRGIHSKFVEEAKTIIARGKLECACCGNKNFKWLQVDHIIPQRKSKNEAIEKLSREIVQGKRPDSEFQLLCANCNFAKRDLKACPIDHSLD
jgi:hypothetical protein